MSKNEFVKTGKEIWNEIEKDYHQTSCSRDFDQEERLEKLEKQKYLILPFGLDKIEEMLKKRCTEMEGTIAQNQVSDVFARFRKELK